MMCVKYLYAFTYDSSGSPFVELLGTLWGEKYILFT